MKTELENISLDDDPQSCGYAQHNPPAGIAFRPGLWAWGCKCCGLLRLVPVPSSAEVC